MPLRIPSNYRSLHCSPHDADLEELANYLRWLVAETRLVRRAISNFTKRRPSPPTVPLPIPGDTSPKPG